MSYAIVTALLVLGLPLSEAWTARLAPWRNLPKPAWRWWQRGVDYVWRLERRGDCRGVATTLVSLLTGVQFFRLLTPGSLATNLVLIPAAMIVTLGGFASLLCGLSVAPTARCYAITRRRSCCWVIEGLVRLSVRLPGAFVPARFEPEWIGSVALILVHERAARGLRQPVGNVARRMVAALCDRGARADFRGEVSSNVG